MSRGKTPSSPDPRPIEPDLSRSKPRLARAIRQVVRAEIRFFSGPLPPPDVLARYNDAFPDCAERIVAMAETQGNHRRTLEIKELDASIRLSFRGQLIGSTIALIALLGGIWLVANDKSTEGFSLIVADVLAFGGAFVYDRYRQQGSGKNPEDEGDTRETQELKSLPSPASAAP